MMTNTPHLGALKARQIAPTPPETAPWSPLRCRSSVGRRAKRWTYDWFYSHRHRVRVGMTADVAGLAL